MLLLFYVLLFLLLYVNGNYLGGDLCWPNLEPSLDSIPIVFEAFKEEPCNFMALETLTNHEELALHKQATIIYVAYIFELFPSTVWSH